MSLSLRKLRQFGLLLLYFTRFITTTVPAQAYLLLVFLRRPKLPAKIWVYLSAITCYWAIVLVFSRSPVPFQHLLFYFAFVTPAIVMISQRPVDALRFISPRFVIGVCALVLLEALVLNSPFASYASFFLPADWATSSENGQLFGFYQRPLGIAGNASMTSGILIFSAVLADTARRVFPHGLVASRDGVPEMAQPGRIAFFDGQTLMVTVTILALASGMGFVLLLLYFPWRGLSDFALTWKRLAAFGVAFAIPLFAVFAAFNYFNTIEGFDKFGVSYAQYLFDTKLASAADALGPQRAQFGQIMFGNQVDPATLSAATSGDFGFLVMFHAIGAVGAAFVLAAPFLFPRSLRAFFGPSVFFYLTFLHYPALMSPPGAVLFGLYLYTLFCYERLRSVRLDVHLAPSVASSLSAEGL